MSNLFKKLKSKAGESLVESMAAILVFTLASIIMMTMVSAAADINTTAKDHDRDFQAQMVVVERGDVNQDTHSSGNVTFHFGDGSVTETIKVDVFKADGGELYAYYEETPTTPVESGGATG